MRTARLWHLYTGVFFAPSILFFAFSGMFQLLELHEARETTPNALIYKMAEVHKHQRIGGDPPAPRPAQPAPAATTGPGSAPAAQGTAPPRPPQRKRSVPFKIFGLAMAVGLMGSTLVGLWMAWQVRVNARGVVAALFVIGALLPTLFLVL